MAWVICLLQSHRVAMMIFTYEDGYYLCLEYYGRILWKSINCFNMFLLLMLLNSLLWSSAVSKWSAIQGACVFGRTLHFCLLFVCHGVPLTCTTNCTKASNAVDWFVSDVRVDIYYILPIIWRLSTLDLPVGKDDVKASGICSFSSSIFWLWFCKRLARFIITKFNVHGDP